MDAATVSLSTGGIHLTSGKMDIGNTRADGIQLTDSLTMEGGTMTMDILLNDGVVSFDQFLGQGGELTLTGGLLQLYGFAGFENYGNPLGAEYALFSGFDAMSGEIVDGQQISINGYDKENWIAKIRTDGTLYFETRPIPEPASILLFGIASSTLLLRRRRAV